MAPFLLVFPPTLCAHLSPSPYAQHAPPISFFSTPYTERAGFEKCYKIIIYLTKLVPEALYLGVQRPNCEPDGLFLFSGEADNVAGSAPKSHMYSPRGAQAYSSLIPIRCKEIVHVMLMSRPVVF
jgi:hypothetical protein